MFNFAHSMALSSATLGCTYFALSQSREANVDDRASCYYLMTVSGALCIAASELMKRTAVDVTQRRTANIAVTISWALMIVGAVEFTAELVTAFSFRDIN